MGLKEGSGIGHSDGVDGLYQCLQDLVPNLGHSGRSCPATMGSDGTSHVVVGGIGFVVGAEDLCTVRS